MARINIEDSLLKDPRFTQLCIKLGSRPLAIGVLVDFWMEAQQWWKGKTHPKTKEVIVPRRSGIPLPRYSSLCLVKEIIEVGLAKVENDAVFAAGAEEQFAWILQKVEAREGATKKAKTPQIELNDTPEERGVTESNVAEAPTPTPTPTPTLPLSPTQPHAQALKKAKKEKAQKDPAEAQKANAFVAGYCERFKARWGSNPEISQKTAGIAKRIAKGLSDEKTETYLDAFFQMPDAELMKKKHPLFLFEIKLNEIVVFANSGQFTTNTQVRQADEFASNMILLSQVRGGK